MDKPLVGQWHTNEVGKLFKVKMILYLDNQINKVLIEMLDSSTTILSINEWHETQKKRIGS